MTRWLGIDYGKRRIGLALSDLGEQLASPEKTLSGSGTASGDARLIVQWATANQVDGFVVGLPLNMDGTSGPQAKLSTVLAEQIRLICPKPVELWDERLSSFQADQLMKSVGLSPAKKKKLRDALAALVILQSFLDARLTDQTDRQ